MVLTAPWVGRAGGVEFVPGLEEPVEPDDHHLGVHRSSHLGETPQADLAATGGDRSPPFIDSETLVCSCSCVVLRSVAPPMRLAPFRSSQAVSPFMSSRKGTSERRFVVAVTAEAPAGSVWRPPVERSLDSYGPRGGSASAVPRRVGPTAGRGRVAGNRHPLGGAIPGDGLAHRRLAPSQGDRPSAAT